MSEECEGLIESSTSGGVAGNIPPLLTQEVLVAPARPADPDTNTVRAAIIPIACWRLDDLRFEFDSSFVRPEAAEELKELAGLMRVHPGAPPSIFGHADPVGNDEYNKQLSGRRAKAVYGMLTRDTLLWEQIYRPQEENWGTRILDIILEDLGFAPSRDNTTEAIKRFQSFQGSTPTGANDALLRAQLFLAYMDKHCRTADGQRFVVAKTDFLAQGADADGKGDYQGCGEFNPVLMFSQSENSRFAGMSDKTERNAENGPNRRVVVLLFRPGSRVTPNRWPCPKAKDPTAGCRRRFWSDASVRKTFQAQRRLFATTKDTFQCRFYQRLTERSPCEAGVERSFPTLFYPEQPHATNFVRLHSLHVYVIYFRSGGTDIESIRRCKVREGKLTDPSNDQFIPLDCNRQAFFYFSHRDDLLSLDRARFFARDRSGLPLLGPLCVPCGPEAKMNINIWDQNDWVIVRGPRVDGERPDVIKMCEWKEDYTIGRLLPLLAGGIGFFPHGDFREKQRQERWKGGAPIDLIMMGNPGGNQMWVGTISALPTAKAKLLLVKGAVFGSSYNEIAPTGSNQDFPGHHQFDSNLVTQLLALDPSDQDTSVIDAMPSPPPRFLLPGDMCWQDQGQTNNCGAFSFSTAMNYWMPYTNNPERKNGALYSQPGNVDDTINGARTPQDIVNAARKFRMNGRDNDAEELNRSRALKMVRLWLTAGVPVLILVEEEYNVWSLHWKTVVGYDGNRFFMNNSGADDEVIRAKRTPGIDYEHAPVGNDVDSDTAFFNKWKSAGGDVVDLITSVDECTFIPLFPKDPMFAGGDPK